jgi:hypothetical protein
VAREGPAGAATPARAGRIDGKGIALSDAPKFAKRQAFRKPNPALIGRGNRYLLPRPLEAATMTIAFSPPAITPLREELLEEPRRPFSDDLLTRVRAHLEITDGEPIPALLQRELSDAFMSHLLDLWDAEQAWLAAWRGGGDG